MTARNRRLPALAACACAIGLAVFHTWPLAAAPHRHSLNYNADAQLNAWIVSWIAYALPREPSRLFAGNIFQPDAHALAYSEPLMVPALAGAPVRWAGASPVTAFNVLLIAGLAATAFATWFVLYRWTGSWWAAMVAGALAAFNTHLLTRLPHLQAAHAWGLPLAFFFTDRLLALDDADDRAEVRRTILALALVVAAVAITSEYWLVFVAMMIAIQAAISLRTARAARRLAGAAAIGFALSLPVLLPYVRLASEGIRRPLEQAAQLSALPSGYLTSLSRVDAIWSHRFFTNDINVLFPGVAATFLALVGVMLARSAATPMQRRVRALVLLAIVAFVLSLGPATPVYPFAYRVVIPLQALRVPARFGYLVILSIALLAGFAVARLKQTAIAGAAVLAIVTIEAWHGPVRVTPFTGVPRIYRMLEREPRPLLLVEAPFWPADAVFGNGEYVLNAADHHFPIANGYSGFTPDSYRRRAQWFWFFPEPWAIATMRPEGVTHVMVHLEQFGAEGPGVLKTIAAEPRLELIASEGEHRLYRLKATADR